jgi:hypothetical protein
VNSVRDRAPACGFCDGTGLWADPGGDATDADPCPLCEGSGQAPGAEAVGGDDAIPVEVAPLSRLLAVLPRLTQAERQRLYEDLYALYDCRIYRR